jgi:DNA-binding transcriptional ArsR family regulator
LLKRLARAGAVQARVPAPDWLGQMDDSNARQGVADPARQLARLGAAFFIDAASILSATFDRDFSVGVTFLTLFRDTRRERTTNWSPVRSLDGDEIPPDTPTSTRHLAEALELPYDTVRRHLRKLRRMGLCESGADGVFAPRLAGLGEPIRTGADQLWRLSRDFAILASNLGAGASASEPVLARGSRFQVTRVAIEYFLDSLALARRKLGVSPVECVVLRAIASTDLRTLAQLAATPRGSIDLAAGGGAGAREPVSVYAVSKTLSLPYETVRRTANNVIAAGWAERTADRGLNIPAAIWAAQSTADYIAEYAPLTAGFLARLDRIDAQMSAAS